MIFDEDNKYGINKSYNSRPEDGIMGWLQYTYLLDKFLQGGPVYYYEGELEW